MIFELLKNPLELVFFVVSIFLAVAFHEFCHAWAATKLGDFTAKYQGRLTLNPLKHIDPVGMILMLVAGFGWGKPVPVNVNALKRKSDEALISVAGPVSNMIFAFIVAVPLLIIQNFSSLGETNAVVLFLATLLEVNILLGVFNLIPIPPLDGFNIVRSLTPYAWQPSIEKIGKTGPTILIGIIVMNYLFGIDFLSPIIMGGERIVSGVISQSIMFFIDLIKH